MDDEDGVAARWTRRSLLKVAGGAALAAAGSLPSRRVHAAATDEAQGAAPPSARGAPRRDRAAQRVRPRRARAAGPTRWKTKHHILDTLGR
jgi:hypothetical protein